MPYIHPNAREEIDYCISDLVNRVYNPGDMNYAVTKLVHSWLIERKFCYTALNEVIGVLECAKQELYRTVAAPYEDIKRKENGPVSELDKEKTDE